jgi:hypothetical protein
MYFVLIEALTYYMDLMHKNFMEYLDKFITVFINNILVYSKSEEGHGRTSPSGIVEASRP